MYHYLVFAVPIVGSFHNVSARLYSLNGGKLETAYIIPHRYLHLERCPLVFSAAYSDSPAMVTDDRLHDRQTQAGAMLLGGVIRSEEALALFSRQPRAGIGQLENGEPKIGRA